MCSTARRETRRQACAYLFLSRVLFPSAFASRGMRNLLAARVRSVTFGAIWSDTCAQSSDGCVVVHGAT
jgi:hypothetical protein